jgi:hypothetical protein
VAQQGSRPPRSGRPPTASRRGDSRSTGASPWDDPAETGDQYPPWAGPAVGPRWADQETRQRGRHGKDEPALGDEEPWTGGGPAEDDRWSRVGPPDPGPPEPATEGPGSRRRMAAARSKRRSRITWVWGGAAIVVAVIVAVLLFEQGGGAPAKTASSGGLVTTFQPGDIKTAPNVCTAVTTATLGQYLPGPRRMIAPRSLDGSAQSLCNWTLDAPPVYRVLDVSVQAYAPSGLATGNGSATAAAVDAYQEAMQAKQHPAKATHLPRALVTVVPRLGTVAFAALQVVLTRGDTTDLETVVARDRNVVVTVVFQGPHTHTGRYKPVSSTMLEAGAVAAARDVVSQLH